METAFRVSVRELVSFTYFPPDIAPMGNVADMLAGTRAHRAREKAQSGAFEIEKRVSAEVTLAGQSALVFGRMDAYQDNATPIVEEMKLCKTPPKEALPDHRAQARVYAALLTVDTDVQAVDVRVVYVNEEGEPVGVFGEVMPRAELQAQLYALLEAWLAFAVPEREHARLRDQSLKTLPFPFAQYRAGQRELAVQVYTAITRKKRLFASLPTGTGKSAAVLYPALKALGEGITRKVVYLTARTTARQSPMNALERMREQGADIRVVTLLAKEKMCPTGARCHPDDCPRAKGHFLRQPEAIRELLAKGEMWTDACVQAAADTHMLCPFELALSLCDLADVALMDMNYAFDPFAQIVRLFQRRRDFTLLADEAHHTLDRVRESLSGVLDTRELRSLRAELGKGLGRAHPFYRQLSGMIKALAALELPASFAPSAEESTIRGAGEGVKPNQARIDPESEPDRPASGSDGGDTAFKPERVREGKLDDPPQNVVQLAQNLCEATFALLSDRLPTPGCRQSAGRLVRLLSPFVYAAGHFGPQYATLLTCDGRERALELYCLSPAETIARVTHGLRGTVFFSATLAPLPAMRDLLGGEEEDACFSLPSPFSPERLMVVRKRTQTRYAYRRDSAAQVAQSIAEAVHARLGKYIAYFPSYAYLKLVLSHLEALPLPPLLVQANDMGEEERARFLTAFTVEPGPKLGLCVLGGLFSEGVDLPGEQLIGALIVGVGLPTPSLRLKTLRAFYDDRFGDGFLYAWMIPAMQKVAQAGGRVIRTEKDRGLLVLIDDRYYEPRYYRLLPSEWKLRDEDIAGAAQALNQLEGEVTI